MTSNALHYLYRKAKTKLRLQLWNIEQNCPPFQLECWTKKSPRVHLGLDDSVHAKIQKRGASHVSLYLDVRNHNLEEKKFLFRVRLSSSINLRVFENVQKCLIRTFVFSAVCLHLTAVCLLFGSCLFTLDSCLFALITYNS